MNEATKPNQPKVLCVDDESNILKSLRRLFISEPFEMFAASSGFEALELMDQHQFDVIISDMRMPEMSGAEFLKKAFAKQPDSYRILMTGYADISSTVAAVNEGRINRYISKPWNNQELITSVHDGLHLVNLEQTNVRLQAQVVAQNQQLKLLNGELEQQVELRTSQLKQTLQSLKVSMAQVERTNQALLKVLYNQISINPVIDGRFAMRVSYQCRAVARQLELPAAVQDHCALAGMLCEVGLSGLPPQLLSKPLYNFDANDWVRFKEHCRFAEEILTPAVALAPVSEMIRNQYEQFNGDGFPDKLVAERIPVGARVLAVVRDYQCYLSARLTSRPLSSVDALRMLKQQQGTVYDPMVLIALTEVAAREPSELQLTPQSSKQGLMLSELRVGMKLKSNVYNQKNMLLAPEGAVLTDTMLSKLKKLLSAQQDQIRFLVESPEIPHTTGDS